MISYAARGASFAQLTRATAQTVGSRLPVRQSAKDHDHHEGPGCVLPSKKLNAHSLIETLPKRGLLVKSGVAQSHQVRMAHTDIRVPDFDYYRRDSTKNPNKKSEREARHLFTYVVTAGAGIGAAVSGKAFVSALVGSMAASADVLALAKIEVKLSDIPEGKNVTFKWRGKPLFVRHRTAAEIATEKAVDVGTLRDPEHDDVRATNPEWLVVIGVCTHLGCVPIPNQGDFGGYYCPCHGSHYDSAGRIRKGPAPLNLEIPPYEFNGDELVVG